MEAIIDITDKLEPLYEKVYTSQLVFFKIQGLYNSLDYEFHFSNNKLVLLGENGSCKTTILRIMCYALSGELEKLNEFNFNEIQFQINNNSIIKISKSSIENNNETFMDDLEYIIDETKERIHSLQIRYGLSSYLIERITYALDKRDFRLIDSIIRDAREESRGIYYEIRDVLERPYMIFRRTNRFNSPKNLNVINTTKEDIRKQLEGTYVLYLPTYRRIEKKISENKPYKGPNFEEMVSFGMDDIRETINNLKKAYVISIQNLFRINFANILNPHKYNRDNNERLKIKNIKTIDVEHKIKNIDKTILNEQEKSQLIEIINKIVEDNQKGSSFNLRDNEELILHNYFELIRIQKDYINIFSNFISTCNKFISNKSISFDIDKFAISINIDKETTCELESLSSGEKQIVSIFAKLYLSAQNYFVFIDEPELSLSINWQKIFLEQIISAPNCVGLVSVTHSPFVYKFSGMEEYTTSLNMFRLN